MIILLTLPLGTLTTVSNYFVRLPATLATPENFKFYGQLFLHDNLSNLPPVIHHQHGDGQPGSWRQSDDKTGYDPHIISGIFEIWANPSQQIIEAINYGVNSKPGDTGGQYTIANKVDNDTHVKEANVHKDSSQDFINSSDQPTLLLLAVTPPGIHSDNVMLSDFVLFQLPPHQTARLWPRTYHNPPYPVSVLSANAGTRNKVQLHTQQGAVHECTSFLFEQETGAGIRFNTTHYTHQITKQEYAKNLLLNSATLALRTGLLIGEEISAQEKKLRQKVLALFQKSVTLDLFTETEKNSLAQEDKVIDLSTLLTLLKAVPALQSQKVELAAKNILLAHLRFLTAKNIPFAQRYLIHQNGNHYLYYNDAYVMLSFIASLYHTLPGNHATIQSQLAHFAKTILSHLRKNEPPAALAHRQHQEMQAKIPKTQTHQSPYTAAKIEQLLPEDQHCHPTIKLDHNPLSQLQTSHATKTVTPPAFFHWLIHASSSIPQITQQFFTKAQEKFFSFYTQLAHAIPLYAQDVVQHCPSYFIKNHTGGTASFWSHPANISHHQAIEHIGNVHPAIISNTSAQLSDLLI